MALALIHGDRIRLETSWRERELCKETPGCRWDSDERTWYVPLSWSSCVSLRGVFGDRLTVSQSLSDWALNELETRVNPCNLLRTATEPEPGYVFGYPYVLCGDDLEKMTLEPMQAVAAQFLATSRRALCGDGCGSGKTIEAISAVETLAERGEDVFPALVVCTNSMVWTWVEELEKWTGRDVVAIKGGAAARRKKIESGSEYFVINWEGLAGHTRVSGYGSIRLTDKEREEKELNALGVKTVIADEAHRAKNTKAKQTRAWWWLSHRADVSIAMTGTPVTKSPTDLWAIMHGVSPEEWPAKTRFIDRYCKKSWNAFGGLSVSGLNGETEAEMRKFLEPRFIRRPTKVVIPDMVEKFPPQVRHVDLPPKQRRAYDQMRDEMLAVLDTGIAVATEQVVRVTRLWQLASAWAELDEEGNFHMAAPSGKIEAMMDVVDELDEEPCVFFAEHRQLIELAAERLEKEGVTFGEISGRIGELERATAVRQFQDGQMKVMLATLGAGGEGITLTRAAHVVFLERSRSRTSNEQATDRVWRRGQDRPVQPIIVVARNTIDEHILRVGKERDVMFEEIVRDEATLRSMLGA